jgi:hypothetical protein
LTLQSQHLQGIPLANGSSKPRVAEHFPQPGTFLLQSDYLSRREPELEAVMNGLIYLVGLIVVILAVLSFFGLR